MQARQCSRVDFPDPLGPMTARISPRLTPMVAPHNAGVWPKLFTRPFVWRIFIDAPPSRAGPAGPPCGRSSAGRPPGGRGQGRRAARPGVAAGLQVGELAHPLQVRGPLDIQVAAGRAVQHQGEHDLGKQLTLQVRFRLCWLGQPFLDIGDARAGDDVAPAFRAGSLLDRPGYRLAVPCQPAQGRVHLAVPERLAPAEVCVVIPLEVVAVARLPLQQAQQGQRNIHNRENTPRVFSQKVAAVPEPPSSGPRENARGGGGWWHE
jgi:hypothetical protein